MSDIAPKRGEVYSVNFGRVRGKQIAKERPALIVQNDIGNQYAPTTIIAAIHKADVEKELPICVLVRAGTAGLTKDSVIDTGHLLTVDKRRLGRLWGMVPPSVQEEVEEALKVSLALD